VARAADSGATTEIIATVTKISAAYTVPLALVVSKNNHKTGVRYLAGENESAMVCTKGRFY
jgi:hypothetical protein